MPDDRDLQGGLTPLEQQSNFFLSSTNDSCLKFEGLCGLQQLSHVEIRYWMHGLVILAA